MTNPTTIARVRAQIEKEVQRRHEQRLAEEDAQKVIELSYYQKRMRELEEARRIDRTTEKFIRCHLGSPEHTIQSIKASVLWFNRTILKNGMTLGDLVGPDRTQPKVLARKQVSYWGHELTDQSYPQIGRKLGNRDHTTILHGDVTYLASKANAKRKKAAKRK